MGVAARAKGRGGPAAAGLGAVAEAKPETRLQVEPHDGFVAVGLQVLGPADAGDQAQGIALPPGSPRQALEQAS